MHLAKRILYLLVLIASLLACDSYTEKPLRVGTIPWAGYEILYLARDLNYYDSSVIELKELTSSTDTIHAFRQGQLDVVATTLDGALRLAETQSELKIILVFNISKGADKLMVGPSINSLADLKNKRIGVEQSGVGTYMLAQVLQLAKLNSNDITTVSSTVNQHIFLLNDHQVDAVITFDPIAYKLEQLGYVNLLDSRQLPEAIIDVLITRKNILKQHPNSIEQLLDGYWQARDYMAKNPQDALTRIAPRLDVSTEELKQLYQNLILPDRQQQQHMFNHQLETIIQSMNNLMIEEGLLREVIDSRQLSIDSNTD